MFCYYECVLVNMTMNDDCACMNAYFVKTEHESLYSCVRACIYCTHIYHSLMRGYLHLAVCALHKTCARVCTGRKRNHASAWKRSLRGMM